MLILLLLPCLAALNLPFYFGVPQYSVTLDANCAAMPFPLYWHRSEEDARVGLRIIVVADGTSYASKKAARRLMAEKLHVSGHLQTGDAVLTFRPYLQDSIAYAHIQMGVTHAGLVYDEEETCFRHSHGKRSTLSRTRRKVLHFRYDFTTSGAAMNIDSPLDSSGEFDAPHYAGEPDGTGGVEALHIIRPRVMASETRRRRLREWVNLVLSGQSQFNGIRHQLEFQPDYVLPRYQDINGTIRQSVTLLGKIVLQIDLTTNLPLFCSEFVFHMISLSACSPDEIRSAGPDGAACVSPDEPFPIMPITAEKSSEIGLADGPLIDLLQIGNRAANQDKTFCSGGARVRQRQPLELRPFGSCQAGRSSHASAEPDLCCSCRGRHFRNACIFDRTN
jgi:hypothetical protein